jgi:hypothetical protein
MRACLSVATLVIAVSYVSSLRLDASKAIGDPVDLHLAVGACEGGSGTVNQVDCQKASVNCTNNSNCAIQAWQKACIGVDAPVSNGQAGNNYISDIQCLNTYTTGWCIAVVGQLNMCTTGNAVGNPLTCGQMSQANGC